MGRGARQDQPRSDRAVSPLVRTEPEASVELAEAASWYEQRRRGLGGEFLEAVDATVKLVSRFPHSGTEVPSLLMDLPVRRAPVKRFPFHVVYIELSGIIRVLAVAHDRRSPDYWLERASQ